MSERLRLDVWLDGTPIPAGMLIADTDGAVNFIYSDNYLESGGLPLSLSLPLQQGTAGDVKSRAFFANLLPENNQTQGLIEREGLEANDIVGILFHMGADCSGAVSCLPSGSAPVKVPGVLATDYRPLSNAEISDIMIGLADYERLPDNARDPSPLAGVQGKIAITVLPDGRWALPDSPLKVPTTHILKVPQKSDAGDVRLEAAACQMARDVGFASSVSRPIRLADRDGLLIERFDRVVHDGVVHRIHQEDFTQALGLPASLKYQRKGKPGRRFDVEAIARLLQHTAQPAKSRETFLLATMFNLVVGNSDNHGKNHGLLYNNGASPNLAPLYDILPIRMGYRYSHQLAFDIGAATEAQEIAAEDFAAFFAAFDLTGPRLRRFLQGTVKPMLERFEVKSGTLPQCGLKAFDDFIGQELERISQILELGLTLRTRDYYAPRGGGWAVSS